MRPTTEKKTTSLQTPYERCGVSGRPDGIRTAEAIRTNTVTYRVRTCKRNPGRYFFRIAGPSIHHRAAPTRVIRRMVSARKHLKRKGNGLACKFGEATLRMAPDPNRRPKSPLRIPPPLPVNKNSTPRIEAGANDKPAYAATVLRYFPFANASNALGTWP